jgi:hypothetical protein
LVWSIVFTGLFRIFYLFSSDAARATDGQTHLLSDQTERWDSMDSARWLVGGEFVLFVFFLFLSAWHMEKEGDTFGGEEEKYSGIGPWKVK